jgi:hypothetical protein
LLKIGADIDLNKAVTQRADEDRAEQDAEQGAASAGERDSAQQNAGQHVELHSQAEGHGRAVQFGSDDEAADGRGDARRDVEPEGDRLRLDAQRPRRVARAADRGHVPAVGRLVPDMRADEKGYRVDPHRDRHRQQVAVA